MRKRQKKKTYWLRAVPKMLALDRMNRTVPVLGRLASQFARFTPSEPLRRHLRAAAQPLEGGYRGVCRGFGAETRLRLIGEDRLKRSEEQVTGIFREHFKAVEKASPLNRMLYVDAKVWLPDDLLLKADLCRH